MINKLFPAMCLALAAVGAVSCCSTDSRSNVMAVHGKVADVDAFDRFIASHPTPEEFRAHYPDVTLVLPGQMATKELRMDRSRYFAQLDADGRITGGAFK